MVDRKIIDEWLAEADEDFDFAAFALKKGDKFFSRICFHFQQAAEKYLKAFIVAEELEFRKIHNLRILLEICKKKDKKFEELKEACLFLNAYYIETRYPVFWPAGRTREEAEKAKEAAEKIANFVKEKIR